MLKRDVVSGEDNLLRYPILLMGPPGIGKSPFVASMTDADEKVFYLDTDISPSLIAYSLPKERVTTWTRLIELVREFLADDYFEWLAIDTLNGAYDLCYRQVCDEKSIDSPSDLNDYGATWNQITKRFMNPLQAIEAKGKGLICTCHSTITEVFIGAKKFNRWIPSFTGSSVNSAYAKVEGFFKILGFMQMEHITAPAVRISQGKKGVKEQLDVRKDVADVYETRLVHLQPSENWVAKDRSGRLPNVVEMPNDWRQDWQAFKDAFLAGRETDNEINDETETNETN